MKNLGIYFWALIAILVEQIVQNFFPGVVWIAPLALVVLAVTDVDYLDALLPLLISILVIDVLSGLPFGLLTIAFILMLLSMYYAEQLIDFRRRSLPFMMIVVSLACIEIVVLLFAMYYVIK